MEMTHLVEWYTMIYLLKRVIFHIYAKLPEGIPFLGHALKSTNSH